MCEILANDPSLNFERDMSVRYNEIKEEIHESKEGNNNGNAYETNDFDPLLKVQRSIDQIPIPPTAPNSQTQKDIMHKINNKQFV